MRIGVDVGGTNTDAVLIDGARVVAAAKRPTTPDIGAGIVAAVEGVLADRRDVEGRIDAVMLGTTHFTNAVIERRGLLEVAAIRAGLPAARDLPPFVDWPRELTASLGGHHYQVGGGYEYDGSEIAPLDEEAVVDAARDLRARGLSSAAVSCIFAPINTAMEERIGELLRREAPGLHVTLSSEIGRIGLLERENAAILNASLAELAEQVVSSLESALASLDIHAPFYLSQNDGTLMNAETAKRYPVLTFASGPTNSMRGAAFLSDMRDAVVIDIGGTTTDVGVLARGFPRESASHFDVGGVRTNFRMPDILSIGLGGGSRVRGGETVTIGPDSVGYRLTEEALVFGGEVLTATDVAVAAGRAEIGDARRVAEVDAALVDAAVRQVGSRIEEAIDRVKTSAADMPVILVGGGAVLAASDIAGASKVVRPQHAAVANAIGAAMAQVGGEVDRVYSYEEQGRDAALERARREAVRGAVRAGADPETIEIVEVEEVPLAYMPGGAVRVRVKAVGSLAVSAEGSEP